MDDALPPAEKRALLADAVTSLGNLVGSWLPNEHSPVTATFHSAYVLRARDPVTRVSAYESLVQVLREAQRAVSKV